MGRYQAKKISRILDSLLHQKKWQKGLTEAEIAVRWEEIVGPRIAAHTTPKTLLRGRLEVACDHDVWRAELQFQKPEMIIRIRDITNSDAVKEIFLK